jgi:hypothetical protein
METWQYGNSLINYMKLVRIVIEKQGDQCKVVFALFVLINKLSVSPEVELRSCPWLTLFKY